jgi:outer membrane receptor protein involved in Fe transport
MKMKRIVWIAILLLMSTSLVAQRPEGQGASSRGAGRPQGEGIIKGMVEDKQTGTAVEYANVVIFSLKDNKMVTGSISDEKGVFRIPKVPFGRYKVVVDFIGYSKLTIDSVRVSPRSQIVDLKKIILSQSVVQLDGVEIVGDRTQFVYKADKKVLAVSQDITSAGGTAIDVLENTSMVDVDVDGTVSLRGSSNFVVFVNGKPSVLDASDALQQLPAANIENIEIITNPSVKYDPDGTAGIINIVLKKNKELGINGLVNASLGTNNKYRTNVLLNYNKNKWNVNLGFDYRDDTFEGSFERERETTDNGITDYLETEGIRNMMRKNKSVNLGVDYSITDNTDISFSGRLGTFEFGFGGQNRFKEYSSISTTPFYYVIDGQPTRNFDYYNLSLSMKHKFGDGKQEIEGLFYVSNREGISTDSDVQTETDANWNKIADPFKSLRSNENSNNDQYRFQLDYTNTFSEDSKLEAGYQLRYGSQIEDYLFESLDANQNWIEDAEFSNDLDYKRAIHSGYAMFNQKFGKWNGLMGLRAEYTDREFNIANGTENYTLERFDLFPSIHFSSQISKTVQMQVSYSRRVNRPRGRMMDPFLTYLDENTRRQGSPDLKPEYIDAFELGWQKRWDKAFFAIEGFYRITTNAFSQIISNTDQGYILYTPQNIGKENALGTDVMFNFDPAKWLTISASTSVYHFKIFENDEFNFPERTSVNWNARFNTTFKFSPMTRLQIQNRYRGASVSAQGSSGATYNMDVALRHDFWKRKGSMILQVRDVFNSGKRERTIDGVSFLEHSINRREGQVVQLTLSYRFNNFKQKRNGRQNGESGDMEMEVEYQ